jgi:hypothetical protein
MKSWKYSTTNDYFDYISFHDCVVVNIEVTTKAVIIDFEFLNISEKHPLNPYTVAKETDFCRLTFNDVTLNNTTIHYDNGTDKEVIITKLDEMEVLQINQKHQDNRYLYEIFGTDWKTQQFCSIKIIADGFVIEWNEFKGDALYIGSKQED